MPSWTIPITTPRHDIHRRDQHRRDGIAFNELAGAIHRAVEVGFPLDLPAPTAGLILSDQPRVQVRIDRHLLARHGIEG
ncbi:MAG: hypothetical protein KatS3mg061_2052 [Dehalococcoidia bacterium]|nr:MAG: hypothetical protein KatS3mg061_2052 [Dehalococcoidia bacterium]